MISKLAQLQISIGIDNRQIKIIKRLRNFPTKKGIYATIMKPSNYNASIYSLLGIIFGKEILEPILIWSKMQVFSTLIVSKKAICV